jgi:hypothetical protein
MRPADVAAQNRAKRPHAHTSAAIEHLHHAVAHETHPEHKAKLAGALSQLLVMQKEMMDPKNAPVPSAMQAVLGRD